MIAQSGKPGLQKQTVCLGVNANSRRGLSESEASQPSNAPYLVTRTSLILVQSLE